MTAGSEPDPIADAIAALTAAARRERTTGAGTPNEHTEPVDFGEIACHVITAVAANVGGVEALLAGVDHLRWPADGLRPEQVAEIRRLKARMERERIRRGTDPHRNLKLGPGGLSDVEWTVQLLQMQHAGRMPGLRTPTTMTALTALREAGLVDEPDARALGRAWRLASALRDHTMLVSGRSSDLLPSDPRDLAAIAVQLHRDMANASELIEDWERTSRRASNVVDRIFWERDS